MKVSLLALVAFSLLAGPAVSGPGAARGALVGEPAPAFALPGPDGAARELTEFLGRPIVVSFWASWCSPCLEELPLLDSLHQRLDGEAMVLGLNIDQSRGPADAIIRRSSLILPVLFDDKQSVVATWRPPAMPTTYLLAADGTVLWLHTGALDAAGVVDLESRVRGLLPPAAPPAAPPGAPPAAPSEEQP